MGVGKDPLPGDCMCRRSSAVDPSVATFLMRTFPNHRLWTGLPTLQSMALLSFHAISSLPYLHPSPLALPPLALAFIPPLLVPFSALARALILFPVLYFLFLIPSLSVPTSRSFFPPPSRDAEEVLPKSPLRFFLP